MSIYRSSARPRPDDDFERGALPHLVAGARGRLLDPRRTPVSVLEVRPATGFVLLRIDDFEDAGATWEVPIEDVDHFQFERGGRQAGERAVAEMQAAIERFDREESIGAGVEERSLTEERIAERKADAARWLEDHSRFISGRHTLPEPSSRRGDPELAADLEAWLRARDIWDMEDELTRVFVSNPGSGEVVKGHRIVLAELGLAGYRGAIVRDRATFEGAWSRERRREHVISRLAFVRALFERLGQREVTVWRGASIRDRLEDRPGRTFVSTSFDEAVARSHFESGQPGWVHVLVRQDVPIEQLFMTYHETAAMNRVYLEAEAVLLAGPRDGWP